MKTKLALLAFALVGAVGFAADTPVPAPAVKPTPPTAAPLAPGPATKLTADAAVFLQPDGKSPVIARYTAGTLVPLAQEDAPTGWRAVNVPGPFDAYVQNKYVSKDLEVKPGTALHFSPELSSASFGPMVEGDKAELVGLHGDWAKVKLDKTVVGYIAVGEMANLPAAGTPAAVAVVATMAPPVLTSEPGRPASTGTLTPDTPRLFQGNFVVARRPIVNPNPPYDYQLADSEGRRFAYVDTKRLIFTGKLEDYVGRTVAVSGTMRNTVDGTALVIAAESIEAR